MIRRPNASFSCGLLVALWGLAGLQGHGSENSLRARARAYQKDFLSKQGPGFGKKKSDETKDGKRLAVGDLFLSKKIHAVVYFKPRENAAESGIACFERNTKDWKLLGAWPHSKAGLAAAKKLKKVKSFDLRDLSSDKAPELILLDGAEGKRPRYRAFRYVRKDGAVKEIARGIAEPFWDAEGKEVLAFDWISNERNTATAWRWSKGRLKPSWRSVQKTVKGKGKKEMIITFHRRDGERWVLARRLRGIIPFYANPAPHDILDAIHTTGQMEGRLSTEKKSYKVSAGLGVMRIASFEMSVMNVLDQFSRGLFADPDTFGPRFRLQLPDDQTMYIAQFGRVRCSPEEHKPWTPPKDEKELVTHARALLAAVGNNDVFALAKLLPAGAHKDILGLKGKTATQAAGSENAETFLDAMPEMLQAQSGKAEPKVEENSASVRVQGFPASPGGRKAALMAGYKKEKEDWVLTSLKLDWEPEKKR